MTLFQELAAREDFRNDAAALSLGALYNIYTPQGHSRGTIHRAWTALKNTNEGNGMDSLPTGTDDLVSNFMGDTKTTETPAQYVTNGAEIVDEQVDALCNIAQNSGVLIAMDATPGEARALHHRAKSQAHGLFETLREIHDRKAYLHLDCSTFRDYMKRLRKEVEYLDISERAFFYQLAHREVYEVLEEAGRSTRGITQHHAAVLNKLPPGMIPEVVDEVRKKAEQYEPRGPAAEFHHPGKVLTNFVEKAVEERLQRFKAETPDPFPPEEEEERPDFFVEARKRPIGEKPLPPVPVPNTPPDEDNRELIDVTDIEFHRGADFIFVGVRVAPGEEYRALVPLGKILALPLWENGK